MRIRARRGSVRCRVAAGLAAVLVLVGAAAAPASAAPQAQLVTEEAAPSAAQQGVARIPGGWIMSGTVWLARTDEHLKVVVEKPGPIPIEWRRKGFNHVGDVDVVGRYVYVPFEQPSYERGDQAMARYDRRTLAFVDALSVAQHENSFVTVDPKTMIAYSMDRFGGDALLRYDVRKDWTPLPPLAMSRTLDRVQGADVADGAVWLSTSDDTNELYRVDLATGQVDDLGSAGHLGGEGEGVDATRLASGRIHTLTVDPTRNPVWFGHFSVG